MVYHPDYNITFGGIEKLHPFDSCKFKKVGGIIDSKVLGTTTHTTVRCWHHRMVKRLTEMAQADFPTPLCTGVAHAICAQLSD